MTRKQATVRAHELWRRRQIPGVNTVGYRVGSTVLRAKSTGPMLRYEVGYYEVKKIRPSGVPVIDFVTVGRGASWEDAFLVASRNRGAA